MADAACGILLAAVEGGRLSSAEERFFLKESPAGITLFRRNVTDDIRVLHELTQKIQSLKSSSVPSYIIAVDQEGGRVSRLKGHVPDLGPALKLEAGKTDSQALAKISTYAKDLASALLKLGINVDFAPVADIDTEPTNTAIGDRCFGKDLESVKLRAKAFLQGLQTGGVLGCIKHFPGQGDAKADTHHGRAVIDLSEEELFEREIAAFTDMFNLSSMVMISHCIYPSLSKDPASLSFDIITKLLKGKLGYKGVVVSDDMDMKAIAQDEQSWQEQIIASVAAGVDLVLICKEIDRSRLALEAIRKERAKSKSFTARVDEALEKIQKMRKSFTAANIA